MCVANRPPLWQVIALHTTNLFEHGRCHPLASYTGGERSFSQICQKIFSDDPEGKAGGGCQMNLVS
jgi:hypothetical protein